jgi:hypothetical protein
LKVKTIRALVAGFEVLTPVTGCYEEFCCLHIML